MTRIEKAAGFWQKGYNCSQSVLTTFAPEFGVPEDVALKMACAFGAGIGRQQHFCGAVTGAVMAIGLKYGTGSDNPAGDKKVSYNKARLLFDEFRKLHGTVVCRELLDGLDMNNPEDYRIITGNNMFVLRCGKYVRDAVRIAENIFEQP
jgi:C_GCAxxG_C_C family probable redox protein